MKDIKFYMALPYEMEIIPDNGSYVVRFPELEGCLTSGKTIEEAVVNSKDAKENWLLAALEDGIDIPLPKLNMQIA